jgi:hypothetical protein
VRSHTRQCRTPSPARKNSHPAYPTKTSVILPIHPNFVILTIHPNFVILSEAFAHLANGESKDLRSPLLVRLPLLLPLSALIHPNRRIVISTEAAHAFVSSAVKKSASLPPPFANPRRCLCFSCCHPRRGSAVVSFLGLERGFSPASSQPQNGHPLRRRRERSQRPEATDLIALAFAFIFLSAFLAQKSHVKPQNHLTL